jgi:hypothetical protein
VECALYANLLAAPALGFSLDEARFGHVVAFLRAMRAHPLFAADAQRAGRFLKTLQHSSHERRRLFWSGDRLEWLLANGFHDWLTGEIEAGRATFPQG